MGLNWPVDPVGGDTGWSSYSFWLVTFTTRQGTVATTTVFAVSATDAENALAADKQFEMLFGPITNVSAAASSSTGVA